MLSLLRLRMSRLTLTLFQESVGVVHGRGTLRNPGLTRSLGHKVSWTGDPSDDDVYGARWAATELFRIDRGNPSPTKMSDVYSFSCLMLQVRLSNHPPYGMVSIRYSRCLQERCRIAVRRDPSKSCT